MILTLNPDYLESDRKITPYEYRRTFAKMPGLRKCVICDGKNDRKFRMTCSACGGEEIESCPCDGCTYEWHCATQQMECSSYDRWLDTGKWEPIMGRVPKKLIMGRPPKERL